MLIFRMLLILTSFPLLAGLSPEEIKAIKKEREARWDAYKNSQIIQQKFDVKQVKEKQHLAWVNHHERESTYFQDIQYFKHSLRMLLEEAYRLEYARLGDSLERDRVWRQVFRKIASITGSAGDILKEISVMGIFFPRGPCFDTLEVQLNEKFARMQALLNQIAQQPEVDGKKSLFLNVDVFWQEAFLGPFEDHE